LITEALVVDASVAAQWLLPEANTHEALQVLRLYPRLAAPDLIYPEVANALWKRVQRGEITAQQGEYLLNAFFSIPLQSHPSSALVHGAWQIAVDFGITIYDALYVALAELIQAPLVTADRRLYAQAPSLSSRIQIFWLADFPDWIPSTP